MSHTLPTHYDHARSEQRIYAQWERGGYFSPQHSQSHQRPFVIVIPPPNVTGVLHMGHGLNVVLQDICARYQRMLGKPTLWLPGTDHAGIATQHVVEKRLHKRGISRQQLGRAQFIEESWKITREHHAIISQQLRRLGASCDWSRERFTLDKNLSTAVREAFVQLYEKGLIYRGRYLVNWCTNCRTALSDEEVTHETIPGSLYAFRYPLLNGEGEVIIETTRPETMLGDTAVAVHPDDRRYRHLVGQQIVLPLVNRHIPIIADSYVDPSFGSGALKVTPAHDPNDFQIGQRHALEQINIFNNDGTLNQKVPKLFQGLTIQQGRAAVLRALQERGARASERQHHHSVGHCYRCHTVIEPLLSTQWFLRMKPLAQQALEAWKRGEVRFFPQHWESTYRHWLENIHDWCISRQLWWGHRIPVWYRSANGEIDEREENAPITVARKDPQDSALTQDEDVLDTWFSSWLWPFSTMGWPSSTSDLEHYYPTTTLITGYDIIFFWVARMIMAGLEFTGKAPFTNIYLTGLVRDKTGRKMAKSLGNGIDPLEIIDEYGADALKFSLTYLMAGGQDILLAKEDFLVGSRFCNKVWNAARFIISQATESQLQQSEELSYNMIDRWIYHRHNQTIGEVQRHMAHYRFSEAAHSIYTYFWYDFCDWYVEYSKYAQRQDPGAASSSHLCILLEEIVRLMHPFLSFISEELYLHLSEIVSALSLPRYEALIIAPQPTQRPQRVNLQSVRHMALLQDVVGSLRRLRSELSIAPKQELRAQVVVGALSQAEELARWLKEERGLIEFFTHTTLRVFSAPQPVGQGIGIAGQMCEVVVALPQSLEIAPLMKRQQQELSQCQRRLAALRERLEAHSAFRSKAAPTVIAAEEQRALQLAEREKLLLRLLVDLEKMK